jgi:hypothetical protein
MRLQEVVVGTEPPCVVHVRFAAFFKRHDVVDLEELIVGAIFTPQTG